MRYVKETLAPDEIILFVGRFPRMYDFVSVMWLLTVVGFPVFVARIAKKRCTELTVTSKRFVYKRGLISRVTDEVATNRIRHVKVTQGILGRLFNYGQIYVEGADIGVFGLPAIRKPTQFRRALIVSSSGVTEETVPGRESEPAPEPEQRKPRRRRRRRKRPARANAA